MAIKIWSNGQKMACLYAHKVKSKNPKTGDMAQLAVLAVRHKPTELLRLGLDALICGICELLGGNGCYVNTVFLNDVWRSSFRRKVEAIPTMVKPLRLGSYGDPALLPIELLDDCIGKAPHWTGYTHQWPVVDSVYSKYLMASIDGISPYTRSDAKKLGYRTFRVLGKGDKLEKGEIMCPNYTHGITCSKCGLCSGTSGRGKADIAIPAHGPANKVSVFNAAAAG